MNQQASSQQDEQAGGGQSKIRLIFHIGTGKTGTTSIQYSLASQREQLEAHGIWYLGLMFENAAVKKFPWQVATTDNVEFHALSPSAAEEQLVSVLEPTIDTARKQKIHTLIWSNESFFERSANALGALEKIQMSGVEISLIVYVRRHDAWARSAYLQWGIKHKTYPGPIQPFGQWIEDHLPRYSEDLAKLKARFPNGVVVRNLDAVKDSVADFFHICKLMGSEWRAVRANESPGGAELFLRALFNSHFQGFVLPEKFNMAVGRDTGIETSPGGYLECLLPTESDLKHVQDLCREDREHMNAIFLANQQPPIETAPLNLKTLTVDTNVLMTKLAKLVMAQSVKIEQLQEAVEKLSSRQTVLDNVRDQTGS